MELEALVRQRKRKAALCPPLQLGEWLQKKRVCLRGLFSVYKRESVVDALRQAGARVYLYPPSQPCPLLVVGEETQQVQPPYLRESQLQHPMSWYLRFEVVRPWYQHFAPTVVEELVGRSREVSELRVWLQQWKRGTGKPALCVSGPLGCGKQTLVECVLRQQGYTHMMSICAVADYKGEQESLLSLCTDLQGCSYNSLGISHLPTGKTALICYSMEYIDLLRKGQQQKSNQNSKKKENRVKLLLRQIQSLIKRRALPVIFVVQQSELDKRKNAFWTQIVQPLCQQQTVSVLPPADQKRVLRQLSTQMGHSFTDDCLSSLIYDGDLRAALVQLEWMIRFESVLQQKDKLCTQPDKLALLALGSTHSLQLKLDIMEKQGGSTEHSIIHHLHHVLGQCLNDDSGSHLMEMAASLSDADLFYPGSHYSLLLPTLEASQHFRPDTRLNRKWPKMKSVEDGMKLLVRESDLRFSSASLRCASARTYNLELLSSHYTHQGKVLLDLAPLESPLLLKHFRLSGLPKEE